MVVKSATKKKLMDMLVPEEFAHVLADDRKWDDVKIPSSQQIAKICETDPETATKIHGIITGSGKAGRNLTEGGASTNVLTQVTNTFLRLLTGGGRDSIVSNNSIVKAVLSFPPLSPTTQGISPESL